MTSMGVAQVPTYPLLIVFFRCDGVKEAVWGDDLSSCNCTVDVVLKFVETTDLIERYFEMFFEKGAMQLS